MTRHFNALVDTLPAAERRKLLANAETVPLDSHAVVYQPGAVVSKVLFPLSGFVSLVVKLDDAPGLEVGMVGSEGMVGLPLVLGASTMPWQIVVQGDGSALQIPADAFAALMQDCPALAQTLHKYAYVLLAQMGSIAVCNRFHPVSQRLCRWLLVIQDRARSDSFRMTQDFLAYMLGVRRVSITHAATVLQTANLIRYHRGEIHVQDRAGLEAAACQCYAHAQNIYSQTFPDAAVQR